MSHVAIHLLLWSLTQTAVPPPPAAMVQAALWAAPKRSGKGAAAPAPARTRDEADDGDSDSDGSDRAGSARPRKAAPAPAATPAPAADKPVKRRPRRSAPPAEVASAPTDELEAEVFGGGGKSDATVRRSAARRSKDQDEQEDQGDEEEDDDSEEETRADVMPVIAPRLLWFGLGGSVNRRSFGFDAPLEQERAFPRPGAVLTLESFPLRRAGRYLAGLGLGGSYERQTGSAAREQADGGTLSYPARLGRWSLDLRYAAPVGERVVLVPRIGYGKSTYDIQRRTEVAPSTCAATSASVCLPDVTQSYAILALDTRIALSPDMALAFGIGYQPGLSVARGSGQLGDEAAPSAKSYGAELALTWQLLDWLALRGSVPFLYTRYTWSGTTLPYRSATETSFGAVVGASVFTN